MRRFTSLPGAHRSLAASQTRARWMQRINTAAGHDAVVFLALPPIADSNLSSAASISMLAVCCSPRLRTRNLVPKIWGVGQSTVIPMHLNTRIALDRSAPRSATALVAHQPNCNCWDLPTRLTGELSLMLLHRCLPPSVLCVSDYVFRWYSSKRAQFLRRPAFQSRSLPCMIIKRPCLIGLRTSSQIY